MPAWLISLVHQTCVLMAELSEMWVQIVAATIMLVSMSKAINCYYSSSPRSIKGTAINWGSNLRWYPVQVKYSQSFHANETGDNYVTNLAPDRLHCFFRMRIYNTNSSYKREGTVMRTYYPSFFIPLCTST